MEVQLYTIFMKKSTLLKRNMALQNDHTSKMDKNVVGVVLQNSSSISFCSLHYTLLYQEREGTDMFLLHKMLFNLHVQPTGF